MANRKRSPKVRLRGSSSPGGQSKRTNHDFPSILFDLDGTLIDSVYEHVSAWSLALRSTDIVLPTWKIHRHIGMSGSAFVCELLREISLERRHPEIDVLEKRHDAEFGKMRLEVLPGAQELLNHLEKVHVRWAIATTSGKAQTTRLLKHFEVPGHVPVVNGDDVKNAKPSPDIWWIAR